MGFTNYFPNVTVDVGLLGSYTLSEGVAVTLWNSGGWDFIPGQWLRAAPILMDNAPGVTIAIGDTGTAPHRHGEAMWIDDSQSINVAMTVLNVGKGTAVVNFQYLSAPTEP
jgi:hypothetical protein